MEVDGFYSRPLEPDFFKTTATFLSVSTTSFCTNYFLMVKRAQRHASDFESHTEKLSEGEQATMLGTGLRQEWHRGEKSTLNGPRLESEGRRKRGDGAGRR